MGSCRGTGSKMMR